MMFLCYVSEKRKNVSEKDMLLVAFVCPRAVYLPTHPEEVASPSQTLPETWNLNIYEPYRALWKKRLEIRIYFSNRKLTIEDWKNINSADKIIVAGDFNVVPHEKQQISIST